jgi:ArsR family transcriptional regulator
VTATRWASRVIAIDRSRPVLERARALARRRGVRNITWRQGEIERIPLRDASVDLAILSQALHHAADPAASVDEATRIVAPGGRVLVLDLREHDQEWVTDQLGDRWRGFSDAALTRLLKQAGLSDVNVSVGARRAGDPFTVLIASAVKPAATRSRVSK